MKEVELEIDGLRQSRMGDEWVVILKEKGVERYLPIYIGSSQADIIRKELLGKGGCDLSLSGIGIDAISVRLEAVVVSRFENDVFHAKLSLCDGDKAFEIDCPPAKALALGVRAKVRIVTEEALLSVAGLRTD